MKGDPTGIHPLFSIGAETPIACKRATKQICQRRHCCELTSVASQVKSAVQLFDFSGKSSQISSQQISTDDSGSKQLCVLNVFFFGLGLQKSEDYRQHQHQNVQLIANVECSNYILTPELNE